MRDLGVRASVRDTCGRVRRGGVSPICGRRHARCSAGSIERARDAISRRTLAPRGWPRSTRDPLLGRPRRGEPAARRRTTATTRATVVVRGLATALDEAREVTLDRAIDRGLFRPTAHVAALRRTTCRRLHACRRLRSIRRATSEQVRTVAAGKWPALGPPTGRPARRWATAPTRDRSSRLQGRAAAPRQGTRGRSSPSAPAASGATSSAIRAS
jgi:hypothetical protein